jgi:hypothetical protein
MSDEAAPDRRDSKNSKPREGRINFSEDYRDPLAARL